ncbi:hypothetical protein C8R44DRAFT_984133 [Mycena epipterygia]|nr:hypothetical protein C8R44DRAFT_984133 [Mycena epipterygia]
MFMSLRSLRYPLRRLFHFPHRKSQQDAEVLNQLPELPNELWTEIFHMLHDATLMAVTGVNRAFNALAVPIYLARRDISQAELDAGTLEIRGYQRDVFPVLQRAFSLPPIHKLSCAIFGDTRFQIICYLRSMIAQQSALQEINLTFHGDIFRGYGPRLSKLPRRTVQEEFCRLINCISRGGKLLFVVGDRFKTVIRTSERGDVWRVARQNSVHRRYIPVGMPLASSVVLDTAYKAQGFMHYASHALDLLQSIRTIYSTSPAEWTVSVLNASFVKWLSLVPALGAAGWARVLPFLTLPQLEEVIMVYGDSKLSDVSMVDLDTFLIRHKAIARLEYALQLPSNGPRVSQFSLASLQRLTHLKTTPAHFIRLHQSPTTPLQLTELFLFAPTSIDKRDFKKVLDLLAGSSCRDTQGLRLGFPGAWMASLPPCLPITCIESMLIFGGFDLDVTCATEFLAVFTPRLKWVEFKLKRGSTLESKLVKALKQIVTVHFSYY